MYSLPMRGDSDIDAKRRLPYPDERERIRDLNAADFQCFCNRVAASAKASALTESVLNELLQE